MQKNVASQSWVVFGFYESNNVATTGDAGNITAKISLDHAAAANTDDTHPTEIEDGYYRFDLTQAETNANHLLLLPKSNTAGVSVIGVPGTYTTTPAYFADLGIESDGDLTKVNELHGHTAQTGDTYPIANNATYGNSAIRTALNTVDDNVDLVLADTNTLQTEWADGGRLDLILDSRASQDSLNTVDANVDAILADTNTLQTEWADGGRLDLILDTVAADVENLDGEAMRGTNNAALAATALSNTVWTDAKAAFLDAAITSRATPTNVSDLQTHGDSNWATATGFSTFDPSGDKVYLGDGAHGGANTTLTLSDYSDFTGGSAPTAVQIRQEIDANSTQLSAILADTNTLQTEWADGGRLDLILDGASTFNAASDTVALGNTAHGGSGATFTLSDYSNFQGEAGSLTAQQVWEYATRGLTNTVTLANGAHGGAAATFTLSDYSNFQGEASGFCMNTAVPTNGAANTLGHYLRVIDAVLGGKTNAATGTANQVQFLDRDGSTVVRTITYGSDDGSRTASTI